MWQSGVAMEEAGNEMKSGVEVDRLSKTAARLSASITHPAIEDKTYRNVSP